MYMTDNGKMINPMELESINIAMVFYIKENGRRINKMEKGLKYGPMGKNMKGIFSTDLNQVKGY